MLIKLPKPVEGGEKAAALLTPFIDEEVAIARLAGEETEPEIRKKGDFCFFVDGNMITCITLSEFFCNSVHTIFSIGILSFLPFLPMQTQYLNITLQNVSDFYLRDFSDFCFLEA